MPSSVLETVLVRRQAYIDGEWRGAFSGDTIDVRNPATGAIISAVPNLSAAECDDAITAAAVALAGWRRRTGKERSIILRRWHTLIIENMTELCRLLTMENGKPLAEAKGEYQYALSILEWSAEEAKRIHGDVIPEVRGDQRLFAIRQPVGVCGAIIAWNFPAQLVLRKAAPALAAGCTVVLKPADLTPLTALALAELAEQAGVPKGVLNIVTGDAAIIGHALTASPVVRKITFTGSTGVGRLLMAQSSDTIKRMSLELGGNAPFIVFGDANVELAAESLFQSRFRNAGQTCVCANRVYVHEDIYDTFADAIAHRVNHLKVGDGLDAGVTIGPLIDDRGLAKVVRLVDGAMTAGAKALIGGRSHELGGTFFEPTVLAEVTPNMNIAREEIFGPVVTLIRFRSDEEALLYANDTEYGLAAYIFTESLRKSWLMAEAVESGMVGVNTGMISNEVGPFGGIKQSGLGREGSRHSLDEFLETKYICFGDMA